jgi:hypothetical protein
VRIGQMAINNRTDWTAPPASLASEEAPEGDEFLVQEEEGEGEDCAAGITGGQGGWGGKKGDKGGGGDKDKHKKGFKGKHGGKDKEVNRERSRSPRGNGGGAGGCVATT